MDLDDDFDPQMQMNAANYMNAVPMQPGYMNAAPMQQAYMNARPMQQAFMNAGPMQQGGPGVYPMPYMMNAQPQFSLYAFNQEGHIPSLKPISTPFTRDSAYHDDFPADIKPPSSTPSTSPSQDKLEITAQPALSHLKRKQEVPCMVSLKGVSKDLEEIESARPGLDLVCVIDISGSMGGVKVELIRQTIGFLITKLTQYDRLSLVIFDDTAYRVCPLLPCTSENRALLEDYAGRFTAEEGTNMLAGLECGLTVLAHRRTVNTVTSMFFLSDGVDNDVSTALQRSQVALEKYRRMIQGEFTLHTFGYGADHDSNIMCNLADQGQGAFHFVEQFESIAEAFSDSFGGLVSQVARNIEVSLSILPSPIPCHITKMYTKSDSQVFTLPGIMANESKDLVFLLQIDDTEISEEVSVSAVRASVRYQSMTGEMMVENVDLVVKLVPEVTSERLNVREDVLVNFYRVKGADILKEAGTLAENGQHQNAQMCLQRGVEELRTSLVAGHTLVAAIIRDLEDAMNRVRSEQAWRAGGAAQVKSAFKNHQMQVASSNTTYYAQPQQAAYNMQFKAYQQKKSQP